MGRGRARPAGWGGPGRVALAAALAAIAVLLIPACPALGASDNRVAALRSSPCPPYEVIRTTDEWTEEEQRAALLGDFAVDFTNFRSYRAHLEPPVNWRKDPLHSQLWRSLLNSLRWQDVLFHVYRQQGNLNALSRARDLVLDWIDADHNRHRKVDPRAWDAKTAGERAPIIAYLARAAACEGLLTDGMASRLLDSLARHARRLSGRALNSQTNHGLYADLGLVLTADYLPFEGRAKRWRRVGLRRFERTLRGRLLEREGVWLEPSAAYQIFVAETMNALVSYANPPVRLAGLLERVRDSAAWFVMPDGLLAQIGDTDLSLPVPDWALARAAVQRGLRTMRRAGFAFVREPGSYLAVGASHHVNTHKQADDLSFQLYEHGHRVVSDGGKFEGDTGRTRSFGVSSPAHSVLTVDNEERVRRPYGSGIVATGQGSGWYAIEGKDPALRTQGVSHRRLFLYRPGEVLVVVDGARATARHSYQRYFQLGPDIDVAKQGASELALSAGGFSGELYDAPSDTGRARRFTVRGRRHPLLGFTFPDFRVRVPRWTVRYRSKGEDLDHVATFGLDGRSLNAKLRSGGGTRVALSAAGQVLETVTVSRSGRNLHVSSDASP
jgi:Heparinase II/III-like protein